ncbi:MAG: hypothetical protein AB1925_12605 [Actinomycetota bacterium]
MTTWTAFAAGIATLPLLAACWLGADWLQIRLRHWWTRPMLLHDHPNEMAVRRSLITGLALELLDARHVRGIRLPFNRLYIIRSNPNREYDFPSGKPVLIGDDYKNARNLFGHVLDQLGYAEEDD